MSDMFDFNELEVNETEENDIEIPDTVESSDNEQESNDIPDIEQVSDDEDQSMKRMIKNVRFLIESQSMKKLKKQTKAEKNRLKKYVKAGFN